jgi:hypothetical protein
MRIIAERLRKVEAKHVARRYVPRLTKWERDALTAAARTNPEIQMASLAAIETEPKTEPRDRARGVFEAFMRADT